MNFLELTLADGRKLDIPPYAVQFLEGLDKDSRKANPKCYSGLFYDVGGVQPHPAGGFSQGSLQSAVVREKFDELAKVVKLATPAPRVELVTAHGEKVLLECERIVSLSELPDDHPNSGKTRVTHRVGDRMLPLDVNETRDDIRKAIADAAPPQPDAQ